MKHIIKNHGNEPVNFDQYEHFPGERVTRIELIAENEQEEWSLKKGNMGMEPGEMIKDYVFTYFEKPVLAVTDILYVAHNTYDVHLEVVNL